MSASDFCRTSVRRTLSAVVISPTMPALLGACSHEAEKAEPDIRPVRSIAVERKQAGVPVTFTGRIEAEDEVSLAFRISGRLQKADANLGYNIKTGQLVAQLKSQNESNALRTAQANLTAAEGQVTQARNHFERQDTLLKQGRTTRVKHDQATQALQTVEAQVDAARAQFKTAEELVGFTDLKAAAPGVVIATGPRAGEVVQVGQMIVRLARKGGRDAVFDVLAQLIRSAPSDLAITVTLSDDPKGSVQGRVRDRSDRCRAGCGQERHRCCGRCEQRTFSSDHGDSDFDRSRHDPDCADGVLGTDGIAGGKRDRRVTQRLRFEGAFDAVASHRLAEVQA